MALGGSKGGNADRRLRKAPDQARLRGGGNEAAEDFVAEIADGRRVVGAVLGKPISSRSAPSVVVGAAQ
jgi:hypothetical protein